MQVVFYLPDLSVILAIAIANSCWMKKIRAKASSENPRIEWTKTEDDIDIV